MDPPSFISFQAVSASNLPLGLNHAHEHVQPEVEQSTRPPAPQAFFPPPSGQADVIDLTNDPDPTPSTSRMGRSPRTFISTRHAFSDSDSSDIIFAGQTVAPIPIQRPPRRTIARRDSPMVTHAERSPRPRSTFMTNVANLTAGIHAGLFSFNPEPPAPPAPGPSRITIRDSPPLQVRRTPNPTATFGGGGRVSGGFFSGLVASGIQGFRGLTRVGHRERDAPDNRFFERIFMDWSGPGERHLPNQNGAHRGRELFAAMFDFGPHDYHHGPIESSYVETDSHPYRIKPGFSKEIIPLDREFLTLDSDSQEIIPVKQEARPVCACCDDPLLLGQESSTSTTEGRRPWILACGHVVDSKCLETARERARAARLAKTPRGKAKGVRGRARKKRPASSMLDNLAIAPTIKGLLHSAPTAASSKRARMDPLAPSLDPPSGLSFPTSLKPSSTSTRAIRARARDARRSTETLGASPQPVAAQPLELSPSDLAAGGSPKVNKGKGKQLEVQPDAELRILDLAPEGPGLNPVLDSPLMLTWTQCPVKDCQGPKGDLLAKKGTKTAPWELFV